MACPPSEDQWASYYNNQSSFININSYDYSGVMTTDSVITTSSTHSGSPTKGEPSPKPVRRRSRASRKTPTTLLNANATNFRSLVQQFTGKPKPSVPPVITPGVHRGPLNINFGEGSYGAEDQGLDSGSTYMPFGYDAGSQQPAHYEQLSQGYTGNPSYGVDFSDSLAVDDLDWGAVSSSVHPWE